MAQFLVLISYYAATISQHFIKKMSKERRKRSPRGKTGTVRPSAEVKMLARHSLASFQPRFWPR